MSATHPTPDERYVRRLIVIQVASRASNILRDLGWELYDWGTAQLARDNLLKLALNSDDPPSVFLEGIEAMFKRAQDVRARDWFIKGKCWRRRRLKRSQA